MDRTQVILEFGESRPFDPVDRVAWKERFRGVGLPALLDEFASRRTRNLTTLDALRLRGPELERRGIHPQLGPVTLEQLLAAWVVHDFTHLAQIVRVMAKRYSAAVGPWRDVQPLWTR
jgi:hypothetical protein